MTKIWDTMQDFNPWWKKPFSIDYREREVYAEIKKYLKMPQILSLTGLRRVGKTTIMLKIVEDRISQGFEAEDIQYFSFDEFKREDLRNILKEYERRMEKDLRSGRYLLLFDEIQKLENWENQVKTIYDAFGKRVKIIISGSESLFLRKTSRETLAGRLFEFKISPLSFREFISFKNLSPKPISLYEKELEKSLEDLILTQGFPELFGVKDKEIIRKYIQESIVEKVIYRDLQSMFNIRDISAIESLLNIFMDSPGQVVDLSDLSKELGITRQTVSLYLTYLEKSFLLRKLYNFSKNRRKAERKLKKYYPSILSFGLLSNEDKLSKSKVLEWLVVNQTDAEFFWRDPYKHEVDIVLTGKRTMPVEVKYGKVEKKGILAFMKKFNLKEGLIVSSDIEDKLKVKGNEVKVIPAYKFLLREDFI